MKVPVLQTFRKKKITHVFIGIDFGTSYTKVSYSYAPNLTAQIETILWSNNDTPARNDRDFSTINRDNTFFKRTILYVQNDRLYFDKPMGESKEIKYFKYSLIENSLKNNSENTKNNFEEMCCVYFLAQLIKRSLSIIKEKLRIPNLDEIKFFINMGVPLENFYEEENKTNQGIYLKILENAITLAGGSKIKASIPPNQVLISNLDSVYSEMCEKKAILNWTANVYPELAAELLLYHQSKFVPDGVYIIIDIGGGTVDMALFQKNTSKNTKVSNMYCLSQRVLPYGIEILHTNREAISRENFQKNFCTMLMESKHFSDVHYDKLKKIDVFFLGGGATEPWYRTSITETRSRLRQGGIPQLNFSQSLQDFIQHEEMLIRKNQRLIISQMLSRHHDDISNVKGLPDFYQEELETRIEKKNREKEYNECYGEKAHGLKKID